MTAGRVPGEGRRQESLSGAPGHARQRVPSSREGLAAGCQPSALDCQTCGACCAFSKHWPAYRPDEAALQARVPHEWKHPDGRRVACVGERCAALRGTLGVSVACALYDIRPRACRNFTPGGLGCRMVRKRLGLSG